MFCTKCGQPAADGAAFCTYCGNALTDPWLTEAQPLPARPPVAKKKTGLIISLVAGGVVLLAALAVLLFLWPGLLVSAAPVTGVWYSESRTEAVQFSPGGVFHAFTHYGEFGGDYQYDKAAGKGRILMNDDKEFDFIVDGDTLYVNNMGAFDRAAYGFDVGSFIGNAVEAPGED